MIEVFLAAVNVLIHALLMLNCWPSPNVAVKKFPLEKLDIF